MPSVIDQYDYLTNNLEGQLNLERNDHQITLGGNVRLSRFDVHTDQPQEMRLAGTPEDEQWAGLFAMDRWQVTKKWALEGQLRGDWYSGTHADWSGRAASLYGLDDNNHHIWRLAAAKAFRAPAIGFRQASTSRIPLPPPVPPGLFGFNLIKPESDLDNEQTWSLETGYSGQIARDWTFRVDAYYQRMEDLIGGRGLPDPMGMGRYLITLDNVDGADTYGAETEIGWVQKWGKIAAWYAYNECRRDGGKSQNIRAFLPARHKTGLTSHLYLPAGFTFSTSYRFTSITRSDQDWGAYDGVDPTHRLDATLAKSFADGQGELLVGISDILQEKHNPIVASGNLTGHDTPGRTFFARLQFTF